MTDSADVRTGRHCLFALHAHLVFVTKFRHKGFDDRHLTRLQEIMRRSCRRRYPA
ncbi:transposase [Micromonospora sp. MS34]|uniref:transposase n=1 Tax=Micromonospora sp. MS34 TaxID=3385971 RepID=UPI0039A3042D